MAGGTLETAFLSFSSRALDEDLDPSLRPDGNPKVDAFVKIFAVLFLLLSDS